MKKHKEDEFDRAMREIAENEDRFIQMVWTSTPRSRKKWDLDKWIQAIYWHKGIIYEKDCPTSEFSPEQWAWIILDGCGVEAQFCPCQKEVLTLLTKDDFKGFGSSNICTNLMSGGDWLAHLMPLDKIEQEDFDNIIIGEPEEYSCEKDVLTLTGAYFPDNKIPAHLNYPHKGESGKKDIMPDL